MSRLAVKVARESFYGEEIMEKCTPQNKTMVYIVCLKQNFITWKLYLLVKQILKATGNFASPPLDRHAKESGQKVVYFCSQQFDLVKLQG